MAAPKREGLFEQIYAVVCAVPAGRVTTYGDVSRQLFGHARAARTVGWALHGLTAERAETVPWWRVINAAGQISTSCTLHPASVQQRRLEDEGVALGADGRIDLDRFGWDGPE